MKTYCKLIFTKKQSFWKLLIIINNYNNKEDEAKCGDIIRLEHMLTKKNLHSH